MIRSAASTPRSRAHRENGLDLATPGLRERWHNGDRSTFWPYLRAVSKLIAEPADPASETWRSPAMDETDCHADLPRWTRAAPVDPTGYAAYPIGIRPMPEIYAELFRRCFSLPGVQDRQTVISTPGVRALWLDESATRIQAPQDRLGWSRPPQASSSEEASHGYRRASRS